MRAAVLAMLISVVVGLVISVPLAYTLSGSMGREGLWLAFLIAVFVTTLGTTWRIISGHWIRRLGPTAAEPRA